MVTRLELAGIQFEVHAAGADVLGDRPNERSSTILVLATRDRQAYPNSLAPEVRESLGPYVWTDSDDIAATATVRRAVVLAGARIEADADITETIVTPWGEIRFE